jgi:hypothetical protein
MADRNVFVAQQFVLGLRFCISTEMLIFNSSFWLSFVSSFWLSFVPRSDKPAGK